MCWQSREKEDCATASASASLVGEIALGTMAQVRPHAARCVCSGRVVVWRERERERGGGRTAVIVNMCRKRCTEVMSTEQVFLGGSGNRLPAAHRTRPTPYDGTRVTSLPDDVIIEHLRLFLTDPTFPAFVNQVEKQLQTIITECQEHS